MRLKLALLAALATLAAGSVEAGMVKDHITNSANWNNTDFASSVYSGGAGMTSIAGVFHGDGGEVTKIGAIFGVSDGAAQPTTADPTGLDWYVNFFDSQADFASNPFPINETNPGTKKFDQPSNVGWQTPIGTLNGYLLRYLEFDVSSMHWTTTSGAVQAVGVFGALGQSPISLQTAVVLSNGTNAIGGEDDWGAAFFPPDEYFGPDTLSNLGFSERFAAFRIETAAVPEPAGLVLAVTGLIAILGWRIRGSSPEVLP